MTERVKPLPTQAQLLSILDCCLDTGSLWWKYRDESYFTTDCARGRSWACSAWNARHAGQPAFQSVSKQYLRGRIFGTTYQKHRVLWKIAHDDEPPTIDHINGDRQDNRICNLRAATVAQNSRNYAKRVSGTSRYRGVSWVVRDRIWSASINAHGKRISLGNFKDELEAAHAYDAGARKYHAEFAVLNFPMPPAREGGE
jgi:hypothetical protein